ncbi:hypothetical protein PV04_09930 [Phialophora macrospora]|uniref:Uncharacterized protein n=1 Tax=Phialophora macrospora TaxID=1851006 RepID=A0A0D2DL05_9EURO|nr:hypothetical protein PV04_09930 [Phialophora macrospora]
MASLQRRLAVGDEARIGTFYNARNDQFLPGNLFGDHDLDNVIRVSPIATPIIQLDHDDSYASKFRMLEIGPSTAATILAGWLDCKGSFKVLEEHHNTDDDDDWSALYHTILTVEEKLELGHPGLRDCAAAAAAAVDGQPLQNVTHVVIAVQWGVRTVITAQYPPDGHAREGQLKSQMDEFKAATEAALQAAGDDPKVCYLAAGSSDEVPGHLDIKVYSDVFPCAGRGGIIMDDLRKTFELLQTLPLHIKDDNCGKGRPLAYMLLPIDIFALYTPLPLQLLSPLAAAAPPSLPQEDTLNAFIGVFDEFQSCRHRLAKYITYVASRKQYLLPETVGAFESCLERLVDAESALKTQFPLALRSARHYGDHAALAGLLHEYVDGTSSPRHIIADVDVSDLAAVEILDELVSKGAVYIGGDGAMLGRELAKHNPGKAYVLYFDRLCMAEDPDPSWTSNYSRFLELLAHRDDEAAPTPTLFAIYDTGAAEGPYSDFLHIAMLENGREITSDLVEYEKFMSERCVARCLPGTFETDDIKKPIKRRFVTMPCPHRHCDQQLDCHWTCFGCLEPVEYGYTDDFFYCACGRSKFTNYEFRCNGLVHGPGFGRPDPSVTVKRLRRLESLNYVNILILGETGVGKSTFVNAMVNYLEFATLDDALASEVLRWVIPCSFSTQYINRASPDNEIEEHFVKVGSRDDEKDGSKGDSATQRTTVYSVTVPSDSTTYTVRLIDTPGIGDARGVEFDKQNIMDILTTISSYDELHGILILLKPNNSRLTITFQYCVKELLVHLHQSAARNMVFGFTNTRTTNYTPGDTFQPLKRLLGENTSIGLSLLANTTYCFDSESFRFLAAAKNGLNMPNKDDFDRSWTHSRDETVRLIEHFKAIPPHPTKSTISLNGARRSIQELTKPMVDISELIRKNIALVNEQIQELRDKELTGDRLRDNLQIQKIQLKPELLRRARTVCTHTACTEIRDDGMGSNEKVIVYKTHCHAACHLEDVPIDVLAPPQLVWCQAFDGEIWCRRCRHHWQEHMHVVYELKEHTVTVTNSTIEQQLRDHATDMTLRAMAIDKLDRTIDEYQREHDTIRDAAAKFGVFLKKHSITPINDATEAYLLFLIKAERDKVEVGGNDTKLKALEAELRSHKETIAVLTRSINSKSSSSSAANDDMTEAGIERLVRKLYNLEHFGNNLQWLQHGITLAHEATNREIPLTVKRNPVNATGRKPRKLEIRSKGTANINPSQPPPPSDPDSIITITKRIRGVGDLVTGFLRL